MEINAIAWHYHEGFDFVLMDEYSILNYRWFLYVPVNFNLVRQHFNLLRYLDYQVSQGVLYVGDYINLAKAASIYLSPDGVAP